MTEIDLRDDMYLWASLPGGMVVYVRTERGSIFRYRVRVTKIMRPVGRVGRPA